MDKLNLTNLMGAVDGDDTVMLIFPTSADASDIVLTLNEILA